MGKVFAEYKLFGKQLILSKTGILAAGRTLTKWKFLIKHTVLDGTADSYPASYAFLASQLCRHIHLHCLVYFSLWWCLEFNQVLQCG